MSGQAGHTVPAPANPAGGRCNMAVRRYGPRTEGDMRQVWTGVAKARPARR